MCDASDVSDVSDVCDASGVSVSDVSDASDVSDVTTWSHHLQLLFGCLHLLLGGSLWPLSSLLHHCRVLLDATLQLQVTCTP